jgi:hypothetical protein
MTRADDDAERSDEENWRRKPAPTTMQARNEPEEEWRP